MSLKEKEPKILKSYEKLLERDFKSWLWLSAILRSSWKILRSTVSLSFLKKEAFYKQHEKQQNWKQSDDKYSEEVMVVSSSKFCPKLK